MISEKMKKLLITIGKLNLFMISQQLAQTFIILKPSNISYFYQEIEFFDHHFMFTSGAISY